MVKLATNKTAMNRLVSIILLALILSLGAYLRFTGISWDETFHLHPDERFLTMIETSISPVSSLGEYFNTGASTLNPHNILDANGNSIFPFFVYGTFPIILVRYAGEWVNLTGYGQIHIIGRYLSGLFDLGTILLVFYIARNYFEKKKWLPHLAAFLYACSVLPVQISHFFIVDNFTTFFSMAAFFAAVKVFRQEISDVDTSIKKHSWTWIFTYWKGFGYYALFALALGFAAASKVNAVVIAILLPFAAYLNDPGVISDRSSSDNIKVKIHHLFFAGLVSILVFRIFQPYAFIGPGFFNIKLNPKWIQNLRELSFLSSGSSNYPPSLQWARRSVWYPIRNMVVWGMGIPFGLSAVLGVLFMGLKIFRSQGRRYLLLWWWTIVYLIWQMLRWNPTMRYLLLIYPTMAIVATWFVSSILDWFRKVFRVRTWTRMFSRLVVSLLFVGTLIWVLAFINVYEKPMTRISASRWVYENVEGAVNLVFDDENSRFIQAAPYPHYFILEPGRELVVEFKTKTSGFITQVKFDSISSDGGSGSLEQLRFSIIDDLNDKVIYETGLNGAIIQGEEVIGRTYIKQFDSLISVEPAQSFRLVINTSGLTSSVRLFGYISIGVDTGNFLVDQPVFEASKLLGEKETHQMAFSPIKDANLTGVELFRVLPFDPETEEIEISAQVIDHENGNILMSGSANLNPSLKEDFRGGGVFIPFQRSLEVESNSSYILSLTAKGTDSDFFIYGRKIAKETDWDDALPLLMYGQNPFDKIEGIYYSDLNFQMYWDDNQEKIERFLAILERADLIIITSNRQWGSTTQIPERFPLTELFYKTLIGCPYEDIQYCFSVAEPEMFKGQLGFELEKTFQVNPQFLSFEFNSQFAEEAFTVYDHPKVLIFRKTSNYKLSQAIDTLRQADLDEVIYLSPEEADASPGKLTLSEQRFNEQKESGTWSELFNYQSIQNDQPVLTVVIWYLFFSFIGWMFYPSLRLAFAGLRMRGIALMKPIGLIFITFLVWLLGSVDVSVTKTLIISVVFLSCALNIVIFLRNRTTIINEIKENYIHIIRFELISLAFFLFFLIVRLSNPDLWHPYKGGEKPMDFSYFNAVIKSIHFPPYDPWYAGGYINYYYFGFMLAAIPTKILGIVPSIAYNLVLPTFFMFSAMAAFSIGGNLFLSVEEQTLPQGPSNQNQGNDNFKNHFPYIPALLTAFLVMMIGNLGTIRMIFQGFQQIGVSGAEFIPGGLIDRLSHLVSGIKIFSNGINFNFYPGDWYWIPSRAIPGEPITEFPYFSFLYGDPHAHVFAYPITLIALCWILSLLNTRFQHAAGMEFIVEIATGVLVIGILKPTNTWDFPAFLGLASAAIFYLIIKFWEPGQQFFLKLPKQTRRIIFGVVFISCFIILSSLVSYPFSRWFGQGYTAVDIWKGDKTPVGSFLVHWGFFLFIIYSWLIWNFHQWLAETQLSALKPYYPFRKIFFAGFLLILLIIVLFIIWGAQVIILIAPAVIIALLLVLRKRTKLIQRFVLLLTTSGFFLTFVVEVLVIRGDIGRMNTVFKFYLQAWTMFAVSSGYFLYDFVNCSWKNLNRNWRNAWAICLALLVISVVLFPILGTADKITDRISEEIPITLDGMAFMRYSTYSENKYQMDLNQDYEAIRWMQKNIKGTPVIAEANVPEYRWGNRFTIYTGLPGVIGWNWHQRQQRAINPSEWVFSRIEDLTEFYSTSDVDIALEFLERYDVDYFIVGQLEYAIYPEAGLEKFVQMGIDLWKPVYRSEQTVIYKVTESIS